MEKIITTDHINNLGKQLKQQRKNIVLVGGCFDLLHDGHISLFEKAKDKGDVLVVLLESDKRIQQLKGSSRPLHTQEQRAHMLSAIRSIDFIVLLPNGIAAKDYDMIVKQLQPAIIATTKGSDAEKYIYHQAEEVGAEVYIIPKVIGLSTSRIIDIITKEL